MPVTSHPDAGSFHSGAQTRRLAQLLDLYERNYRLIERLIPELEIPFDEAVSKSASDFPLHLTVRERDRYTVTFKLTYEFVDATAYAGSLTSGCGCIATRRWPRRWNAVIARLGRPKTMLIRRPGSS